MRAVAFARATVRATVRAAGLTAALLVLAACGGGSTSPASSGGGGGGGGGGGVVPPGTIQATAGSVFSPSTVTIAVNNSVTFQFFTTTHNVTFDPVAGVPANIGNSSSTSVVRLFTTVGTFPFQCTIHAGMAGSVVVTP